jgi:hypothetical protein
MVNSKKKRKLIKGKKEQEEEEYDDEENDILHPDIPMEAKFIPLSELIEYSENKIEKQEQDSDDDDDDDDNDGDNSDKDSDDDKETETTSSTSSFIKKKKKKKTHDKNFCYGCKFLLPGLIDKHEQPHVYALKRVIDECKGQMSSKEYYKKVSEQQYHHCVKKFENTEYCQPIWSVEMVKEHFENHISDFKSELENDVKFLKALALEQSKTLISKHELSDHTVFDRSGVDSYLKTLKTKKELLCALYSKV